jgi:hypothetical protein
MKTKIAVTTLFVTGFITMTYAQDDKVLTAAEEKALVEKLSSKTAGSDSLWKFGGSSGLNFSQVYLSNWAGGGQSSISATGLVSLFGNYKKGKSSWDNTLDLAYGVLRQGDAGQVIKTDDRIDFSSKYGRDAGKGWFYSGFLNFRTQFAPGYPIAAGAEDRSRLISDFLAPAYLLAAIGMDYKSTDKFTIFMSPATLKTTIVMNQDLADIGAFGVEKAIIDPITGDIITPGQNIRNEVGGFLKMMYKTEVMENVTFQTRIDLFSNYLNNPQNIDINWETLVTMKINKWLNASIATHLIYDDDIKIFVANPDLPSGGEQVGPRVQFKEVLSLGISYKF